MATDYTKLFESLDKAAKTDVFKKSVDSMKEAAEIAGEIRDLQSKASDRNNQAQNRMLKGFGDSLDSQLRLMMGQVDKFQKMSKKAKKEGDEVALNAAKAQLASVTSSFKTIADRQKQSKKEIVEYNKLLEKSSQAYMQDLEDRKAKVEELGKAGYIFEEKLMGSLNKGMDLLESKVSDLSDLPKSLFGSLSNFASLQAGKLEQKASQETDDTKALGFMKAAASLAKLAKVFAVVGGGLAAVVSLFVMAEGKVKDMNKSLLEGISATDMMAVKQGDLAGSLKDVRKAFTRGSFLNTLGMTSDEVVSLAKSLDAANLGFRALGGGEQGIKAMQNQMVKLKESSVLMGISMEEAVSRAESFAYEIGVSIKDGSALKSMVSDFADIRDMAVQTGYSTNNFYEKVKDLTSSLDNMNLRSKEAGSLFIRLGKVVGPDGVSGFLSNIANLKSEGYLEQIKRQMLTNPKKLKKILDAEAKRSADALLGTFGESEKGMSILNKAKIDTTSNEGLIKSIQNMSQTQIEDILGELAEREETAGLGRELSNTIDLALGADKNASRTDISEGLDAMGAGAGLAAQYARLETHLGGRSLAAMSDIEKEAMMKFTDLNKDQMQQFEDLQEVYKGQLRTAKRLAKKKDISKEDEERLANMGLKTKDGKLMTKSGALVDDISTFILAQSETINKSGEAALTQEQLLREQVSATVSVADKINNYLGQILMDISSALMSLVSWSFSKGSDESEETKALKKDLITELKSQKEGIIEKTREKHKSLSKTEAELARTKDPKKKQFLKDKLAQEQKDFEDLNRASRVVSEQIKVLNTYSFDGKQTTASLRNNSAMEAMKATKVYSSEKSESQKKFDADIARERKKAGATMVAGEVHVASTEELAARAGYTKKGDMYLKGGQTVAYESETKEGNQTLNAMEDSNKYLEILAEAGEPNNSKKSAVEEEKAIMKDGSIKQEKEKEAKRAAELALEVEKRSKLKTLASTIGLKYGDNESSTELAKRINQRNIARADLEGYGYTGSQLLEMGVKLNDGFYSKGKIYPINSKDSVMAFKDNGPIQNMLGGNTINANISVNGARNPGAVAQEVVREIDKLKNSVQGYSK
jgi:hypothetical protein